MFITHSNTKKCTVPYFFSRRIVKIERSRSLAAILQLVLKVPRGRASGFIAVGERRKEGEKKRGTADISLQLAFKERVAPATQGSDWLLFSLLVIGYL